MTNKHTNKIRLFHPIRRSADPVPSYFGDYVTICVILPSFHFISPQPRMPYTTLDMTCIFPASAFPRPTPVCTSYYDHDYAVCYDITKFNQPTNQSIDRSIGFR